MDAKQTKKDFQEWFIKHYAGQYKTEEALSRIHRIAIDAWHAALLQSSIPPEPQAGVELTDEEIKEIIRVAVSEGKLSWLGYNLDENGKYTIPSLAPYHYQLARAIERALNQRRAVKTGDPS